MRKIGVLLLAPLALLAAVARAGESRISFKPCVGEDVPAGAKCATYSVFENRQAKSGREIPLNIIVIPATGDRPEGDPIFFLVGGPGEAATNYAGEFTEENALRRRRDIVLIDQRGTGGSNGFRCKFYEDKPQSYLDSILALEHVRKCRDEILRQADPRFYTTRDFIEDLEDIRKALGYEKINLFGGSYGTRASLIYLKHYPDAIRAAVLSGVTPPNMLTPSSYARDSENSLNEVFQRCKEDKECHEAFPQPEADLRNVLERLAAGPVSVTIKDQNQEQVAIQWTLDQFVERLRLMLYSEETRSMIPFFLRKAAEGNLVPFTELAYQFSRQILPNVNFGLLLSVTCAEENPFIDQAAARKEAEGTFYGNWRLLAQTAACREWPAARLNRDVTEPVGFGGPVLLVSGELDPVTPPRWTTEAARTLPKGKVIVLPGATHFAGDCLIDLAAAFLDKISGDQLDVSCATKKSSIPFLIEDSDP